MAYFPNGTAGEIFDEQCSNCLHGISDDIMCPVCYVQTTYNYDQTRPMEKKLRECLNSLVNEKGICMMKTAMEECKVLRDNDNEKSALELWEESRK